MRARNARRGWSSNGRVIGVASITALPFVAAGRVILRFWSFTKGNPGNGLTDPNHPPTSPRMTRTAG